MSLTADVKIPGYVAGRWSIDSVHSDLSFTVRHMMVSKVRGHFGAFTGEIVTAASPLESTATASIDVTSITTGNEQRDTHLRSQDFFEVDQHPTMTYRTTGLRAEGNDFVVDGELTLKGVTRPVTLQVELNGFGPDAFGGTRLGLTAQGEINRRDFNVTWSAPIEGGGVVVSDKVGLLLEVEAVLDSTG